MTKIAVIGMRHGHIFSILDEFLALPDVTLVGAVEEDPAAAKQAKQNLPSLPLMTKEELFSAAKPDIVLLGNYYAARGGDAILALQNGCHVYADKPLCTDPAELDEIERLAKEKNRKVGLALSLRRLPWVEPVRELLASGQLGQVYAASFGGQHPLSYGVRDGWYFEKGKQGGTISDLAIHGVDLLSYLTGSLMDRPVAARCYNAFAKEEPDFLDCAQFLYTLQNGCGVVGDTSYAAPDGCGYAIRQYWRFTLWAEGGVIEACATDPMAYQLTRRLSDGEKRIECAPCALPTLAADFLSEIEGKNVSFKTGDAIRSTRDTLRLQMMANASAGIG